MTTKYHQPSRDEAQKVEDMADAVVTTLLEEGLGPGFAGAVLTVSMAHILAVLDEEKAMDAMEHHAVNALKLSKMIRGKLDKLDKETKQ